MTTILLVEDDEMNREMIFRHLKWQGYEVAVAGNGAQAVDLAYALRPSLILMDMGLPVRTGWEATQEIKADPDLAAIPIVALTAYAMSEDRQKSIDAGCDAFETKPIDFERLFTTVRRLLASGAK
jgi:two-component system, cell cycle response regulator DivK